MDVDKEFPIVSEDEAVKQKNWAAGAREHVDSEELIMSAARRSSIETVKYPPALLKIFDEILVNALDQVIRTANERDPKLRTTAIDVVITPEGEITIRNNGRGIPIVKHNAMSAREGMDIYLPTFLFNYMHQSSNHVKAPDNIIGGTNGMGAKIVIIMSKYTRLVTVDGGRRFTQEWADGRTRLSPPRIEPFAGVPFTSVTFMPDYAGLFYYPSGATQLLLDLYYTRVVFAAFYLRLIAPRTTITYNGVAIGITPETLLMELYPDSRVTKIALKPNGPPIHMRYPWEIYAVGVDKKVFHTSVVNGIVVPVGTHMKFIKDNITEILSKAVIAKLANKSAKIPKTMFKFSYIAIAPIPNPRWGGQRKDQLVYDSANFAPYTFTPTILRELIDDITDKALEAFLSRKTRNTKMEPTKYKAASAAGTSRARDTILFCVEGDSAFAQAEMGISKTPDLTFERCGLYSLGGVIVNARKEIIIHDPVKRIFNKSEKWLTNPRVCGLIDVLGLNYQFKYEPGTPSYEREMKSLLYGRLIAAVDQDHDGKGNILPLLMSLIAYLWPGLIASGYVGWIMSPICQVYPKAGGKILQFYTLDSFDKWASRTSIAYDVKYCKGLAGNDKEEGVYIFKKHRENTFLFTLDSDAEMNFDIYLGDDPNKRKAQLSKISIQATPEMMARRDSTHRIPASEHLLLEADAFQKDNLLRKLDNYIDGLTKARRKVLDGCIDRFRSSPSKRVKVADLAAKITSAKQYEHGEASLQKTITLMAATYIGGRQLPYLVPVSMFGSRTGGPKTAGAPRYIYAQFNWRLGNALFPPEDYPLLKFTINEGQRGEPEYFVPIIPTVILESIELPSHGWKLKKWARDAISVIDYVKTFITNKPAIMRARIEPYSYGWFGEYRAAEGKIWAVGRYEIVRGDTDSVVVTEIPMSMWTNDWVGSLRAKIEEEVKTPSGRISRCERDDPYIASIDDRGNNGDIVRTVIIMKPGAIEELSKLDDSNFTGIEKYFNLRKSQKHNLNLMTEHNTVREFNSYERIISEWFPHRRALYAHRMRRRKQTLQLRLELEEQTLRYITTARDLTGESIEVMTSYATAEGYPRLKPSLLVGINIMTDDELERQFYDGDFNYLFKINGLKRSSGAIADRRAVIADIKAKLVEVVKEPFPGAIEWLAELEKLRGIIIEGRSTEWKYKDATKYTFE